MIKLINKRLIALQRYYIKPRILKTVQLNLVKSSITINNCTFAFFIIKTSKFNYGKNKKNSQGFGKSPLDNDDNCQLFDGGKSLFL